MDKHAPLRKLTKKELWLSTRPWITYGILTSMRTRDSLYKKFAKESNPTLKKDYYNSYKVHRNKVKSLIRTSKKDYFAKYFEENNSNVKKTWEGIRNLINVSKKSSTKITKLFKEKMITNNLDIANSMNNFL